MDCDHYSPSTPELIRSCGCFRFSRPDWPTYFLGIAEAVKARGDCIRDKVGSVLVDNTTHWVMASGYNGSRPGGPSCLAGECERCLSDVPSGSSYDNCIEKHSEENNLDQFYDHFSFFPEEVRRKMLENSTMYITRAPCAPRCIPMLQDAGVGKVVWPKTAVLTGSSGLVGFYRSGEPNYLDLTLPKM